MERLGKMRSKRVSAGNVLGEIALRLSDQQARVMKLENNKTPTVPVYDDIENDPPTPAVEGQIALSMADLKVWWHSNEAWHTCGNCFDRLGLPGDLVTKGGYLDDLPADQPVAPFTKGHSSLDVILHQGAPCVAWVTTHTRTSPTVRRYFGPYAAMWNGSDWDLLGDTMEPMFEWDFSVYPNYEFAGTGLIENVAYDTVISRIYPHIRSDGTNLYVVYYALVRHSVDEEGGGGEDWGTFQVRARQWTGSSWSLLGTIDSRLENNTEGSIAGDQDSSMGFISAAAEPEAWGAARPTSPCRS